LVEFLPPNSTVESFRLSLEQAVAWCSPRVDTESPETCLRSADLRAAIPKNDISNGYWQSLDVVNLLVAVRASLVASDSAFDGQVGRLVGCDVSASEASEGARVDSNGFFDAFDVPPWDTWVAWFPDRNAVQSDNGYLVGWIPDELVVIAQSGIDASPVECVFWADDPTESAWSFCKFRESVPSWYLDEFAVVGRRR
jgi:hypothetical protein